MFVGCICTGIDINIDNNSNGSILLSIIVGCQDLYTYTMGDTVYLQDVVYIVWKSTKDIELSKQSIAVRLSYDSFDSEPHVGQGIFPC